MTTMPYTISKQFEFSASHQLLGLADNHPCARHHGHNYKVAVELAATELNAVGFVVDYNDLKPLRDHIDTVFDHRHLNDVLIVNPTAENIARYFFVWCRQQPWGDKVVAVRVSETDKTWAEYRLPL